MAKRTDRDALAKLDALYARLPKVDCRKLCGDEICGPIFMTVVEAERVRRTAHRAPRLDASSLRCTYLNHGRCTVYAARPLICRVFGIVKRMSCPHGCLPERWLTDHEFVVLAREVERIGGGRHVMTAPEGLVPYDESFADLPLDAVSEADAERLAEQTRTLRALHHGRIIGVAPRETGPSGAEWVNLDTRRDDE